MTLATRPHWRCSTTRREGTCSRGRGAGASQGLQPQSPGTRSCAPDGQTLPQTLGPSKLGPGITDSADKGLSSELEEAKGREPTDAEPTDGVAPADQNSTHPPGLGGAGVGRACIQTSHASAWEPSSAQPRATTHGLPQVTAQPWLELRRPRTREVHGRSHTGTARGLAPPGCKSQPGRGCEVVGSRPSPENRTLPAHAGATGAPAGRPDGRRVDRGPRERRTLWLWHLKVPEL